jgi:branched-chain amino acid aminotransferase
MSRVRELVAYVNGRIVPLNKATAEMSESESRSPGGLYDTERTFKGEVFKLREHLQRLYNSLEFARIDPGLSMEEMESITLEVLDANRPLLKESEDFILGQVVSMMPNYDSEGLAPARRGRPTVGASRSIPLGTATVRCTS